MASIEKEKGMSIFLDVFRRADKNDDNCLSWDEFRSFFTDGVLTSSELDTLFHEIDTHNTTNIDTGELCTYFSKHLGPYREIFAALEDINSSVSTALQTTATEYPEKNFQDQFCVRFLLKEVQTQLAALLGTIGAASDHLEEEAVKNRSGQTQVHFDEPPVSTKAGWLARRAKRQLSTQTSIPFDSASMNAFFTQVNRLQEMLDKLENRVTLDPVDEEIVKDDSNMLMLVARKLCVLESEDKPFRSTLRTYVEAAAKNDGCLNLSVRSYSGTSNFVLYEMWDSEESWKNHFGSNVSKAFRHSNVDHLEKPEEMSNLAIPASWISDSSPTCVISGTA
ncbi:N-terminal EF-hand calcium-binding protein 1-like isoform X2 [Acanthaster planci]|uniref:N-terminal EF-hand calcium-binding protein 1-like isoform X2 n=1 Tax=Acanthaster planci TaxID=133434 RepID=A0A8B7ZSS9_ACAPL|nr:N-terminal EF-hand calcium-binding protein 1-like isoform X2 [Acanthaster planci]